MKTIVARSAAMGCLTLLMCASIAPRADAQYMQPSHWQVTYQCAGQTVDPCPGNDEWDWPADGSGYIDGTTVDFHCKGDGGWAGACTEGSGGSITPVLVWVLGSPPVAPHSQNTLAAVIESAAGAGGDPVSTTALVDDGSSAITGLTDPTVTTLTDAGNGDVSTSTVQTGTHLYTAPVVYDDGLGTWTATFPTFKPSASFSEPAQGDEFRVPMTAGVSVNVKCDLDTLDPLPPSSLWDSDPVVLYHGTKKTFADQIAEGATLESAGAGDFGKGFYTVDGNALDKAELLAWRAVGKDYETTWGVVEFDVPLVEMLQFFCDNQAEIVGFTQTGTGDPPPWNSPKPGIYSNQPNENKHPIDPNKNLNWWEFCWLNWYYRRCVYISPPPNPSDEGTPDYIPFNDDDGAGAQVDINWTLPLTWGPFFDPPANPPNCTEFSTDTGIVFSGTNQYMWGDGGGIALLNDTKNVGRLLKAFGVGDPRNPPP